MALLLSTEAGAGASLWQCAGSDVVKEKRRPLRHWRRVQLAVELREAARSSSAQALRSGDLEDQDRARWDTEAIGEGTQLLDRALRHRRPGPYQLQAAIAALHAQAE
jgi:hypothetical protein